MHRLRPTPAQPVFYGQVHYGYFLTPFAALNIEEADIAGHRWAPRWWRKLRLRESLHIALIHPDLFCGVAIFDAKLLATSFCYLVDHHTHRLIVHERSTVQPATRQLSKQLLNGTNFFRQPGYHLQIASRLTTYQHHLNLQIEPADAQPGIHANITLHEDLTRIQPLITVLPVNDHRRPMYTHQCLCAASGMLQTATQTVPFEPDTCLALFSVRKGFFPSHSSRKWAAFAGFDDTGAPLAITLSNQLTSSEANWSECAAWIDNQLYLFNSVKFTGDPEDPLQPWRIKTTDQSVDLRFAPQGQIAEHASWGHRVDSTYGQLYGLFDGTIACTMEQQRAVNSVFGFTEILALQS